MSQRPQETNHGYNMRLAEQIYDLVEHGKLTEAANIITARQIEALKEGARRAANVIAKEIETAGCTEGCCEACGAKSNSKHAILTTAEQWTEKDL